MRLCPFLFLLRKRSEALFLIAHAVVCTAAACRAAELTGTSFMAPVARSFAAVIIISAEG